MKLASLVNFPAFDGMEFSTFILKHGVPESELPAALDKVVKGLYANEDGFLSHAVL